jgi:hypothetical protein
MYVFRCDDLEGVMRRWREIIQQHAPQGSFDSPFSRLFDILRISGRVKWFFYTDNANGIAVRLYDRPFKTAHPDCFRDKNGESWVILRGRKLGSPEQQCKTQMRTAIGQNMWTAAAAPTGPRLLNRISLVHAKELGRLNYFEDQFHNNASV